AAVEGVVDRSRRFDHMQQHTGQHLLSRVFADAARRATVGFHLGERTSTIDLDGPAGADLLERVEKAVNELVVRDLPVAQRIVSRAEYEAQGAKAVRSRLPEEALSVRIVEIGDVDGSTCCGTHCPSTGMVGLVKILSAETVRGGTRVEFVCGMRAVFDYAEKHALLQGLARSASTDWREIRAIFEKLQEENRGLGRERDILAKELAGMKAEQIGEPTGSIGPYRLVRRIFDEEDAGRVREMISKIRETPGTVVLFGIAAPKPALLFACTPGLPLDMGAAMRAAAAVMGARGGGGADFAQGGGGAPSKMAEAIDAAVALLEGETA
ncbi:MAG: alanyl-tRNA editing protein, partial [Candidatus Krumholzibacteria bacterium]|nr:alanyl-tRNA editing protein [Candidatus Krumholzibacteria bacterium]